MLDGSLTAFQRLKHPLLQRRQLGSGLVHRSPGTLFSGIHKPLCLVLRFKSHGLPTVLHQKLHTQLDGVRKSIESSRPEAEELPLHPSDPADVALSGLSDWHAKGLEASAPDWNKWGCRQPTKFAHSSQLMARKATPKLNG